MTVAAGRDRRDWVGDRLSFALAWGVPIAALIRAGLMDPLPKTLTWAAALSWMGVACLANAIRCGRMHCFFTGPFFLLMAVAALLHGFQIVGLGPSGWLWLGITTGVGGGLLWCVPELLWGKFSGRETSG